MCIVDHGVDQSVVNLFVKLQIEYAVAPLVQINTQNVVSCQFTYVCQGECVASDKYVEQLDDMMKHSMPKKIAGFMAEYIQVCFFVLCLFTTLQLIHNII